MSTRGSRREFLKAAGLSIGAAGLGMAAPAANDRPSRPNILFILADDLGYGDLGCYGQDKIKTPNIDRLATEGTRYTNCYAGSVVCAPSRSVLMTGQHTGHTRVRGNSGKNAPKHDGQAGRIPLHAEDCTVAQVLRDAGYATAITGKWGLGEPGSTGLPNDHGFDEWLGYLNQDHAPDYFTDYLWHNKTKAPIPENRNGGRKKYSCDLFTDFACEFIREQRNAPFFLYLAYTIPHLKLEVPELGAYADEDWPADAKTFAAMVTRMDGYVGRLMALLDEIGIAENTVVFLTSDNGASTSCLEFFNRCGPLREKKGSLHEGGIRTPMIVRWPGKVAPGAVSSVVWYFADFLPTAAALAGAAVPSGIDGLDVLPSLLGGDQPELRSRFLYWECVENGRLGQAVRWGDWKAVRHGLKSPIELYDLSMDVAEGRDVAAGHPDVVETIGNYLATARVDSPYWPIAAE